MSEQGFGRDATFPPCSPDFNLIENVWAMMVERMSTQKLDTVKKLEHAIRTTWKGINQLDILSLYSSWRSRIAAVIEAKGGHTVTNRSFDLVASPLSVYHVNILC